MSAENGCKRNAHMDEWEQRAPEDLEDLVDFGVAWNERQTGSHLGENGGARPDVDLMSSNTSAGRAESVRAKDIALLSVRHRTHGRGVMPTSEQNLERSVPKRDDLTKVFCPSALPPLQSKKEACLTRNAPHECRFVTARRMFSRVRNRQSEPGWCVTSSAGGGRKNKGRKGTAPSSCPACRS